MSDNKHCPKCEGAMTKGFILDGMRNFASASNWQEGAPQRSIWTGVKLHKEDQHEITSYRCERCGFLESYAG